MSYLLYPLFAFLFIGSAFAQNLNCTAAAQPPLVRQEGLTERTGDIVLTCSGGTPNLQVTGNLTLFLSVNITNRVAPGTNRVTDVVFTADNGSGPRPSPRPAFSAGPRRWSITVRHLRSLRPAALSCGSRMFAQMPIK